VFQFGHSVTIRKAWLIKEKTQWYFQRYMPHLPSAGEMVLFDRSWYNRAGVEPVMGFCTNEEYTEFMSTVNGFELALPARGSP
jgi:polyphosphate kinase 2 (PPK2 family)